jgi:hypothetical protein
MDTVVSDGIDSDDGIDELIEELPRDDIRAPESSTTPPPTLNSESTTPGSIFYPKRDSELARLVNCDLDMNDLATTNSPDDIWANLNKRCIQKFGDKSNVKKNASLNDLTWAYITLPAYLSWNLMGKYHDEINNWIIKINAFSTESSTDASQKPIEKESKEPPSQKPIEKESKEPPSQKPIEKESKEPPSQKLIEKEPKELPSQGPPRPPPSYKKLLTATSSSTHLKPLTTASSLATTTTSSSHQKPIEAPKSRKRKGGHSERASKKSHTEGDLYSGNEDDNLPLEESLVQNDDHLNAAQMLLLNKGKKLREILMESSDDAHKLSISKDSNIKIMDIVTELSAEPIEITDVNSAAKRIQQWKNQEKQYSEFLIAAESYNLYHLMSFVQVYEDLLRIGGEILKKDPKNNIKSIKSWVIKIVCDNLGINQKMEQRQRLGCDRLRSLFNEGITCDQLARAGLKKCDFFTSQSYYDIFISQIPSMESRRSILSSSTESRLSEVTSAEASNSTRIDDKKKKKDESIMFRLLLGEEFNSLKNKYKDDEYVVIK